MRSRLEPLEHDSKVLRAHSPSLTLFCPVHPLGFSSPSLSSGSWRTRDCRFPQALRGRLTVQAASGAHPWTGPSRPCRWRCSRPSVLGCLCEDLWLPSGSQGNMGAAPGSSLAPLPVPLSCAEMAVPKLRAGGHHSTLFCQVGLWTGSVLPCTVSQDLPQGLRTPALSCPRG